MTQLCVIKSKSWTLGVQLFLLAFVFQCLPANAQELESLSAKEILDKCIKAHGGFIDSATLSFTFRGKKYKGVFNGGSFQMLREFKVGDSTYLDKLDNNEFVRTINGKPIELSERKRNGISNSVNSVFYFAMLPYKLNDKAVILSYIEKQKTAKGEYYLLKVSFKQEGGGEDHQDQFRYWVNAKTYLLDYFAYSYETSGGGVRFRAASRRHALNSGYIFQDYVNFKSNVGIDLNQLLYMHGNGKLKVVSKIELVNVQLKSNK